MWKELYFIDCYELVLLETI